MWGLLHLLRDNKLHSVRSIIISVSRIKGQLFKNDRGRIRVDAKRNINLRTGLGKIKTEELPKKEAVKKSQARD